MEEIKSQAVNYEMFGAKGDGVTDDSEAIRSAHEYANSKGIDVVTNPFATYYIGPAPMNVPIKTNVDFSTTKFIIDDRNVKLEERGASIFTVLSDKKPIEIEVRRIRKNQMKLDVTLPCNCYCKVDNAEKKQFIRFGLNQNNGSSQTDCFVLDSSGYILNKVIWDFENVTSCVAYPIDEQTLTVKGGIFTVIANQAESKYNYHARNIKVFRSNTVIEGITHLVTGELDHGAPYSGFVDVQRCAYVTVRDCYLTPRKIYSTIGAAGKPVSMGSYALLGTSVVDFKIINIKQSGIMDRTRWGLMATNHCKDIYVDGCVMSRFDAHENVANLTIKNTVLGHQCFNAIGHGLMTVENVTAYGSSFLNLRGDYGSSWDGDVVFKNNTWYPNAGVKSPTFIGGTNRGDHDFGFRCSMPHRVKIENLLICDGDSGEGYVGCSLIGTSGINDGTAVDFEDSSKGYPYYCTENVEINAVRTDSGKGFAIFSGDTKNCYAAVKHFVGGGQMRPNMRIYLNEVEMPSRPIVPDTSLSEGDYGNNHRIVPYIVAENCDGIKIGNTNTPAKIKTVNCTVSGSAKNTVMSCDGENQ